MMNRSANSRNSSKTGSKTTKKVFFKKRQGCPLSGSNAPKIDYKDPVLLSKFISPESCRMMPSRVTNVSAAKQRELRKAIKISRNLALMPFVFQKEINERN